MEGYAAAQISRHVGGQGHRQKVLVDLVMRLHRSFIGGRQTPLTLRFIQGLTGCSKRTASRYVASLLQVPDLIAFRWVAIGQRAYDGRPARARHRSCRMGAALTVMLGLVGPGIDRGKPAVSSQQVVDKKTSQVVDKKAPVLELPVLKITKRETAQPPDPPPKREPDPLPSQPWRLTSKAIDEAMAAIEDPETPRPIRRAQPDPGLEDLHRRHQDAQKHLREHELTHSRPLAAGAAFQRRWLG